MVTTLRTWRYVVFIHKVKSKEDNLTVNNPWVLIYLNLWFHRPIYFFYVGNWWLGWCYSDVWKRTFATSGALFWSCKLVLHVTNHILWFSCTGSFELYVGLKFKPATETMQGYMVIRNFLLELGKIDTRKYGA